MKYFLFLIINQKKIKIMEKLKQNKINPDSKLLKINYVYFKLLNNIIFNNIIFIYKPFKSIVK